MNDSIVPQRVKAVREVFKLKVQRVGVDQPQL